MTTKLNINQIRRYLPHRYPFLLVDAVDDVVPGESLRAHKCVSANEQLFTGHFPDNPVMPGVLQVEAMAQASALLVLLSGATLESDKNIYITGIDGCKFKRPIVPGDVMDLRAQLVKAKLGVWKLSCEVYVGDKLASQANLTATKGPKLDSGALPEGLPPPPEA